MVLMLLVLKAEEGVVCTMRLMGDLKLWCG